MAAPDGPARHTVVLLRHGESVWNLENRFTGWTDVDLTPQGVRQALRAGALLRAHGFAFDTAFTSLLRRAIRTLHLAQEQMDLMHVTEIKSWRLNERHYGALQGLNKAETAAKHGEEQVHIWRRSYSTPPPPLDPADPRHPAHDPRYAALPPRQLPPGESLRGCVERCLPFWGSDIVPAVARGERVLVAAHGNSLRGIVKHLDAISDQDIMSLEIPVGAPLVYELDEQLRPVRHYYLGSRLVAAPPLRMAVLLPAAAPEEQLRGVRDLLGRPPGTPGWGPNEVPQQPAEAEEEPQGACALVGGRDEDAAEGGEDAVAGGEGAAAAERAHAHAAAAALLGLTRGMLLTGVTGGEAVHLLRCPPGTSTGPSATPTAAAAGAAADPVAAAAAAAAAAPAGGGAGLPPSARRALDAAQYVLAALTLQQAPDGARGNEPAGPPGVDAAGCAQQQAQQQGSTPGVGQRVAGLVDAPEVARVLSSLRTDAHVPVVLLLPAAPRGGRPQPCPPSGGTGAGGADGAEGRRHGPEAPPAPVGAAGQEGGSAGGPLAVPPATMQQLLAQLGRRLVVAVPRGAGAPPTRTGAATAACPHPWDTLPLALRRGGVVQAASGEGVEHAEVVAGALSCASGSAWVVGEVHC